MPRVPSVGPIASALCSHNPEIEPYHEPGGPIPHPHVSLISIFIFCFDSGLQE
jgi:hypothetical protein